MASPRPYSIDDLELLAVQARIEARASFWAYRQYATPGLLLGWWQRAIAVRLQQFAADLAAGKRPVLLIEAPPQHGKSAQVVDFIAWLVGHDPALRVIYASFSDRLGVRANLALQRVMDSSKYQALFPEARINNSNVVAIGGKPLRNREIVEFVGRGGFFRNTTVLGSVTGEGLDLGVIDDPLKGREAANSPTIRDKTWDWFTDDFFSRFSERAGMLMVMTRWHPDDPAGRLLERGNVTVAKYPAVVEGGMALAYDDPRGVGEVLFPEHKSAAFLVERKGLMSLSSWESLYQQNPTPRGERLFAADRLQVGMPGKILRSVRYWDKAGTQGGGAFTAGALVGVDADGRYWVLDMVRGQWGAPERERMIKQTAEVDDVRVPVWVEQEPGSGGKESAEATIRNLAGWTVKADRVSGDKETRAEPFASQVDAGNVWLQRGAWNRAFIDECGTFPGGKFKDQVDAASGAFVKLTGGAGKKRAGVF